jgi:virginiamycin B lyase
MMIRGCPGRITRVGRSWGRLSRESSSAEDPRFLSRDAYGWKGPQSGTVVRTLALLAGTLLSSGTVLAQQTGQAFPEGQGKSTVVTICGSCHDIGRVTAGYTPEGWRTVVRMMLNFGAPIPPDQVTTITDYLSNSFPEKPRPAAVLIPGAVEVSIKEWPVATPGSRPHDPLAARDGSLWYSGQLANVLGRLDPATGQIKEYHVNPLTGPHGLKEDKDGNIWFTGNFAGMIGKLDPKTGSVVEYRMPDSSAKDPHTLVIDHDGIIWFTVQVGNKIGRLDPKTGEIKLVNVPTPNARPYGIAVNSRNVVYFVEYGAPKIATIDSRTMEIREFGLPDAGARPRRLAIGPDDAIWYSDFARGYLGRLDPATGETKEWPSPSGPKSQPYGIVFTKDAVWYSESAAKPNTIVRFDPKTEKFQTWAIPGNGDIVRNMDVNRDGNPVMANSLTNQVGLIEISGTHQ